MLCTRNVLEVPCDHIFNEIHVPSTSNINFSLYNVKCKLLETAYFDPDFQNLVSFLLS